MDKVMCPQGHELVDIFYDQTMAKGGQVTEWQARSRNQSRAYSAERSAKICGVDCAARATFGTYMIKTR